MGEIQIIMPHGAFGYESGEDRLDTFLRAISVKYGKEGEWASKYGTDYEDDIIMLHRFCWCEQPDCPWCAGCVCPEENWESAEGQKWPVKTKETCDYCLGGGIFSLYPPGDGAPNFWHKSTGFRVWWYKYIGRGMRVSDDPPEVLWGLVTTQDIERLYKEFE